VIFFGGEEIAELFDFDFVVRLQNGGEISLRGDAV
jgi:hypothetical protein